MYNNYPLPIGKEFFRAIGNWKIYKNYSFILIGFIFSVIIAHMRHTVAKAIVAVAIISISVYLYAVEINDNIYGTYIGEKMLFNNMNQIINSPLNDLPKQGYGEHSDVNVFNQIFLEFGRWGEKWDNALHGRHVESRELRYQPERVNIWRNYWRTHTHPTSLDTFLRVTRVSDIEAEISFKFMRTTMGRQVISKSVTAYLPNSSNPTYSGFFAGLRAQQTVTGEVNNVLEMQRYEDLRKIVKILISDSTIQWSWKEGMIGRPHVKDYLTPGVIGTFSRAGEEVTVSLNYLGDLEVHKQLKVDITSHVIHKITNILQTPIGIIFRRVPN